MILSNQASGVVQDQSILFLAASYGHWLYRSEGLVKGIAPIVELHYSTTMQDSDVFFDMATGKSVSNPANRLDVLNMTAGIRLLLGESTFVTFAGVAPLRDEQDKVFDSEFSIQLVRTR